MRIPNQPDAKLFLHHGDLSSTEWILNLIYSLAPDELYHLAAQSHVKVSFDIPEYTGDITGLEDAIARSNSPQWCEDAVLSGVEFGDVWLCSAAAKRDDGFFSREVLTLLQRYTRTG